MLTNFDDFVNAGFCIDVDVADSFAVSEHRDALSRPLNVPHQLGWTSRDDQVDHLVQSAQILHLLTSAHLVGKKQFVKQKYLQINEVFSGGVTLSMKCTI